MWIVEELGVFKDVEDCIMNVHFCARVHMYGDDADTNEPAAFEINSSGW